MDEKEVDASSSAPHKRSKSVPAMSPAFLNDTQLQDQQIVGRSRSNTVGSVERLVRTQRRGARLSSGGLLRNPTKKRRNKETLVKSRSADVVDRDERDNSSRKSSNSSESNDGEDEGCLRRARKRGFCLPSANSVVGKLKTMEDEKEFPSNIDSAQTNFSGVCSASEENFAAEQQLNSMDKLHDNSKSSESKTVDDPSHPSLSTENGREKQEKITDEKTFDFQGSKINIRRKSLPVDLSEYQIYSNLEDYSGDDEYRTRLMSCSQTDMKFQNNYGIVYKKGCQNKLCRRWQSMPESLYKVNVAAETSTDLLVSFSLGEKETAGFVEPVELESSNMQGSRQHQEIENCTSESCSEKDEGEDDTMANKPILEKHSSSSEKDIDTEEQMKVTKRSNRIKRSFSLPIKFDISDEDERQDKETRKLKRAKSLNTGESFDEVFPVMLSEKTTELELDIENIDAKHHEKNGTDEKEVEQKKTRRGRGRDRRRAKSLPVSLVLEEIPEESPEHYRCSEYESVEDLAKKHINRAFQELLRKIQKSQRPTNKLKRTRSLSTIKEATASNETLMHEVEVESRQQDDKVTLEKPEEQNGNHAQKHVDITADEHEPKREEHPETPEEHEDEDFKANYEKSDRLEEEEEEENNDVKVDLMQQASEESLKESFTKEEKDLQLKNENPQLSETAKDETLALQQELMRECTDAEELLLNIEKKQQLVDTTQESTVLNETLNQHVKEEISSIHKAKEELHIDIPQIFVNKVECGGESQLSVVDSHDDDDDDGYDVVDGCVEPEGSSPQTEDLKSPDDEDIQGTILEHINNMDFTFDNSINQRSIASFLCMERIPEDPDKENAVESPETEITSTETERESSEVGFDTTDDMDEQSTLKRAGSMRKRKGHRGNNSSSTKEKSWPITDDLSRDQKRVTWSDLPDTAKEEEHQVDQEDDCQDQYEPGPRGDFIFTGAGGDISEDTHQDEFEGPRGGVCFTDEHGTPADQSVQYKSDQFDFESVESKFDVMVRNAINSYLEPDYTQSESSIHRAVALGNVDHLRELLDEGANSNALDEHGWPPLHVATLFNKIDCAELLLQAGADLQGYTDSLINEYKTLAEQVQ